MRKISSRNTQHASRITHHTSQKIMRKLLQVSGHEYWNLIGQRSFWLGTLGFPVMMAVLGLFTLMFMVAVTLLNRDPVGYVDDAGILNGAVSQPGAVVEIRPYPHPLQRPRLPLLPPAAVMWQQRQVRPSLASLLSVPLSALALPHPRCRTLPKIRLRPTAIKNLLVVSYITFFGNQWSVIGLPITAYRLPITAPSPAPTSGRTDNCHPCESWRNRLADHHPIG